MESFTLHSFPRAIIHVDGDSFFVSCEIAKNPALRGKPVVTGSERGIASAMSYEAKARGITRAMKVSEMKRICPEIIILPSDYETYCLYSKRMYDIVRRYTPQVEEYSIDECFADITGLRRSHHSSYEEIAKSIKHDLETELGITFSLGLGPTKVLAKVGSKWKKPAGLTVIPARDAHLFLEKLSAGDIWGIGPQTSAFLAKHGIHTALDFATRPFEWVQRNLTKPHHEMWHELRGTAVMELTLGEKHDYQSISKTKTFTPPSKDKEFVFSQLSKNIENACIKARRHSLATREVSFFLKTQDFRYSGRTIALSRATALPQEILALVRELFDVVYRPNTLYRATGVVLSKLGENTNSQMDLFGAAMKAETVSEIYKAIDTLSEKYGKHTVFLGSSLTALTRPSHHTARGIKSQRSENIFKGETKRQRLRIPMLGEAR